MCASATQLGKDCEDIIIFFSEASNLRIFWKKLLFKVESVDIDVKVQDTFQEPATKNRVSARSFQ